MKEGFLQLALGDREAARAAFARILGTLAGRHDPDASLALTNCLDDDDARLAGIDAVLERQGLAGLARIDPGRPLGLDNIRGLPAPCRLAPMGRVSVIVPAWNAAGRLADRGALADGAELPRPRDHPGRRRQHRRHRLR